MTFATCTMLFRISRGTFTSERTGLYAKKYLHLYSVMLRSHGLWHTDNFWTYTLTPLGTWAPPAV